MDKMLAMFVVALCDNDSTSPIRILYVCMY